MPLRAFVINNLRWKLTALLLAMLAWFAIKLAIYKGSGHNQLFVRLPVAVLKAPDDPTVLRLQPAEIDLVVQATKELNRDDLAVFVDVRNLPLDVESAFKKVMVRGDDVTKVTIDPPVVRVIRVRSPDALATNVFKKL